MLGSINIHKITMHKLDFVMKMKRDLVSSLENVGISLTTAIVFEIAEIVTQSQYYSKHV